MKNILFQKKALTGLVSMIFTLTFAAFASAQVQEPKAQPKAEPIAQEALQASDTAVKDSDAFTVEMVSGEVSGIGKNFISIIYNRDYDAGAEYETMLPLDGDVKIKHKQDIKDIKPGDLVSAEYEKPAENSKHKPKTLSIIFIQSGVNAIVSQPADSSYGATQP